ncbi:DUF2785 domain-containing protein [Brevibacillus laterosporus]|uniref:DUF2785 domain-containing protein n=1 Tax=Brevibacillus laterosporus TaxID=1465 RepID=UPI000E6C9A03|nr:DUF2785 domain-containing protein [Brevibacillus laterosporus]AYB38005.1 DUF2785 domain-containing protein [Brevibacillus laterosporus]MBG9775661.1 hypothetical protein [Brevibacillus laterosporus]MBM7110020.1 hypothetical protein [Brevibacillus laterosporus]NKQ21794.1 DUF2785 domain-containing protein [Brevibacillus laterosporus]WNX29249.1 DUF2785 domain-containing protein [Brevibacillus laterosporus]
MSLKKKLLSIKSNDFEAPPNAFELALEMTSSIGSPDPQLRDELIYSVFSKWILDGVLSPKEMSKLLTIILNDQHLFYRIGETGTDSVFTRSFSVLLIPLILIAHKNNPFLKGEEILQIKENLFNYIAQEIDLRGYVAGKGWAHATAHAADALDDLAQCLEIEKADLQKILDVVRVKITVTQTTYLHEEDERMVTAVLSVLKRDVFTNDEIDLWIKSFFDQLDDDFSIGSYAQKINVKNFFRSLYYRLHEQGKYPTIIQTLFNLSKY